MARVAILGNAAGGKSTLARRLAQSRDLEYFEIDKILWNADWSVVDSDAYQEQHRKIVEKEDWVIDGGGSLETIRDRLSRATEAILLDLPLWAHFFMAAERQAAWARGKLEHPPAGISNVPPTRRLFQMIWEMDREWMPILRTLCDQCEAEGKSVLPLTSLEALDAFSELL